MTHEKLKACPWCGSEAVFDKEFQGRSVRCGSTICLSLGPQLDHDGSKWNALPRRDDVPTAPPSMSDGELICRAILATMGERAIGPCDELRAEFSRRAAARQEGAK